MPRRFLAFRYAIFSLIFLTVPLRANLGETVSQCVARYGKPVHFTEADQKTPFGTLTFASGGYALIVFLLDNAEVGARVSKLDQSAFTPAEVQNIMGTDTDGSPWTPTTSDDPACLEWTRSDKATVIYDKAKGMLIFTSPEMVKALHPNP